jgi:MFS family permease
MGDKLGRRRVIFLATAVSMIGAILMASSYSLAQFIVARLAVGLGTGGYVATVPVWQSELSTAAKRGAHVSILGIFIGAGISIALWIDLGLYFVPDNSVSWRFPLGFQIVLSVMVMVFVFLLPESPRWLIKKGRLEEARHILAALEDVEADSDKINEDIEVIQASLEACGTGSIKDMFKMGEQRMFHRTTLAAAAQTFQQLNGINAITFYATTIFEQYLGIDPTKARILAAAMPLTQRCCYGSMYGHISWHNI